MASIGKDLATIRRHLGISLENIHQATKIPLLTLTQIEDGSLFSITEENPTYIRSFVRSYAKAIKMSDDIVVQALDQQDSGSYTNLLLNEFPEITDSVVSDTDSLQDEEAENESVDLLPETSTRESTPIDEKKPYKSTPPPPSIGSVNWAAMGHKFKNIEKSTPTWIIGLIVVIIIAIASAYFIYEMDLLGNLTSSDEEPEIPDPIEQPDQSELGLDFQINSPQEEAQEAPAPVVILDDTLYITVYAAYERLDPVRIWSDMKRGMDPYWIDHRTGYNFEFQDTIRILGQYDRMLLFLNGHRIDNFRQLHFNANENAVELTRELFTQDPQWAETVPFELPEDTPGPELIQGRPTF